MKLLKDCFISGILLTGVMYSSLVSAATITYEATTNRPQLFQDVGLDLGDGAGLQYYDVTVTWDQTFYDIFGTDASSYPSDSRLIGWGDVDNTAAAVQALSDALAADSFTNTTTTSYLAVPQDLSNNGSLWLHQDLIPKNVITSPGTFYGTVGYTQWSLTAVPIPAAVWLFGSGLIGLIGLARRKKS